MPLAANTMFWFCSFPGALRFRLAAKDIRAVQERVLFRIIRSCRDSRFGKDHHFSDIKTIEQFRTAVPLLRHEDLAGYIGSIMNGEKHVLFGETLECLYPTSGTSAPTKLIPHTVGLRDEFRAGIDPWVFDMYRCHPTVLTGRAYWAISPPGVSSAAGSTGVSLGTNDDTCYLNLLSRKALKKALAVPPEVTLIKEGAVFRYVTLAFLVAAGDLTFVSVWNPTFLSLLLQDLYDLIPALAVDLDRGSLNPPGKEETAILKRISESFVRDPVRAKKIMELRGNSGGARSFPSMLWPRLALISCWADGSAAAPARELRTIFPETVITGKGLLATEGIVTFPIEGYPGKALSINSHFYEFIPDGDPGNPRLSWELEFGQNYEVVITTSGGFFRYRLGDKVRLAGHYHHVPMLEFLGRGDKVSDLFGEKLHEEHVLRMIADAVSSLADRPSFSILVPGPAEKADHYILFLAGENYPTVQDLEFVARGLESGLMQNFHYKNCRNLGQLKHSEVVWMSRDPLAAFNAYQDFLLKKGQCIGSMKPPSLDSDPALSDLLLSLSAASSESYAKGS